MNYARTILLASLLLRGAGKELLERAEYTVVAIECKTAIGELGNHESLNTVDFTAAAVGCGVVADAYQ